MKFKGDVMRKAAAAALSAALLASCGGGTQIDPFEAARVIAFGDEASVLNANTSLAEVGASYTVKGVKYKVGVTPPEPEAGPVLDCTANPIWVQQLAASFGMAFAQCPGAAANLNALVRATPGAKAADFKAQVDAFLSSGRFADNDLVSVMVGANEIIDIFENRGASIDLAGQAGVDVGAQVVRITDLGAKVVVATIPDVGLTPYAAAKELATPGSAALLSALSARFNTQLRLKLNDVRNGGRSVGLLLVDDLVLNMARNPAAYGLTNLTQGACTAALPTCDATTTLVDPAPAVRTYGNAWLWADDRHLGPVAHNHIGALAVVRAHGNPF